MFQMFIYPPINRDVRDREGKKGLSPSEGGIGDHQHLPLPPQVEALSLPVPECAKHKDEKKRLVATIIHLCGTLWRHEVPVTPNGIPRMRLLAQGGISDFC